MELRDLTLAQLTRIYVRLYNQIPYGGSFGWDWRTLRGAYPSIAFAMLAVREHVRIHHTHYRDR